MANVMVGFPNRIDGSLVTGGAWADAMPLANLKDRLLSRIARSINLEETSTTFLIDLGRRQSIKIFALVAHNMTLGARYRLEASNNADLSAPALSKTYDAWGRLAGGRWDINALQWENRNYWLGGYTQEDIAGQTPVASQVFPLTVTARYWRVTILDRSNQAGFAQVGRVFMGDGFLEPTINMNWGANIAYEDATTVDTSLSGVEFFDPREPVRVVRFTLAHLSPEEGLGRALELTRRAGISREVFFVWDPDDKSYGSQRNFLGRLRQLQGLETVKMMLGGSFIHSMPFEIKEIR